MTVRHGGPDLYDSKKGELGEDPLRPDADPARLRSRVLGSRKSIGQLIMVSVLDHACHSCSLP